jgi:hypothetical protein
MLTRRASIASDPRYALPLDQGGESELADEAAPWFGYFTYIHPRLPHQTDAQWDASQRCDRHGNGVNGIFLYMMQRLAKQRGHHRSCKLKTCRRSGSCTGRNPERSHAEDSVCLVPPCVPWNSELREEMHAQIQREVKEACDELRAKGLAAEE